MKIKLKYFLMVWVVLVLLILWGIRSDASLNSRVKLTGCKVGTKAYSVWELHQYKDTTMMRRYPLCWCPYRAYLAVFYNVEITTHSNKNWIVVKADLVSMLSEDAEYNRNFARNFPTKGNRQKQISQIFRYCHSTLYQQGKKYAKDVFQTRQGDCAGIASAFYVLCKAKRIPVRYVIGWTKSGCHAWNRVKVSGHWYWIDPTIGLWLSRKQYTGRKVMEIW